MRPPDPLSARGRLITIDGPDGGGKTTQAERLAAHLREAGEVVLVTREPGGTWLGERVRDIVLARRASSGSEPDPLADALLFNAARRQLVRDVIRPALAAGTTVVCARFADSTLAYQGAGSGVPIETLRALADIATDGLRPDVTVILDIPVEDGLARKAPGDITRFEADLDADFHRRVRDAFLAIATAEPDRMIVVDARPGLDEVTAAVIAAVSGTAAAAG